MDEQKLFTDIGKLQQAVDDIRTQLTSIDQKVDDLPCMEHRGLLKSLTQWKEKCNGNSMMMQVEKYKSGLSLKNALILMVGTVVVNIVATLLITGIGG